MYCEYYAAVSKRGSAAIMYCQLSTTHTTCSNLIVYMYMNKKQNKNQN